MTSRALPRSFHFGLWPVLACFMLLCLPAQAQKTTAAAPELDQLLASKESGLLTDWRVLGPLGHSTDLDHIWPAQRDQLRRKQYGSQKVVTRQFASGRFELPESVSGTGVFYAASELWLPSSSDWRVYAETAGAMIVYIDGKQIMETSSHAAVLHTTSETLRLERGNHRVLVKFAAQAAPFHIAVMPQTGVMPKRNNKPQVHLTPEAQYVPASFEIR